MRRLIACVILGLLLFVLVIPLTSLRAQTAPPPVPTPAPSADDVMARADKAIDYASRTTDQSSMVLGFIQGISIILGAIITAGGGLVGFTALRTLRDYDSQLKQVKEQLAAEAGEAEKLRKRLEADTDQQVNSLRQQAMAEIGRSKQVAERTTRALTLLQLGEGQFETGNVRAAIRAYEEAYALDPGNRAANYQLGELYIIERDLDKAVEHLEYALKDDPEFAPAIAALGYAWRLQGDRQSQIEERNQIYAQAEQKFIEALRIDPNVRDANKQSVNGALGALYKRQGRIRDAIHYYLKAEETTPNSSYPVNNLAQLYFMQGDEANAQEYFNRSMWFSQRAISLNPFDFWARFDTVTAEIALGTGDDWRRDLVAAAKQAPMGTLDTLLSGLRNLKAAPKPPAHIDEAISLVEKEIQDRKAGT